MEKDLQLMKQEMEKILNDARKEAKKIISDAKKEAGLKKENSVNGLSEAELNEIKKNEEYVEIELFKDNEKYQDDVYVAVGGQNCVIKRGIPVKIKRKFYLALQQQKDQDLKTARLIEKESKKSEI